MRRVTARSDLAPIAPDDDFASMVPLPVAARDTETLRRSLFERHRIEVRVRTHTGRTLILEAAVGRY